MTQTRVVREIQAPVEVVFDTVAHIESFAKAVPDIVRTEFVSETTRGVGTRFRETRLMKGKEATTELEVTEYVDNERIRIVADSHGTVWDTVFTVEPSEAGARLTMTMDARARALLPRLINPLIRGMIQRAVEQDLDAVKRHCEELAKA